MYYNIFILYIDIVVICTANSIESEKINGNENVRCTVITSPIANRESKKKKQQKQMRKTTTEN